MDENELVKEKECDYSLPFLFGCDALRLVQIQPIVKCNLRCRHCYSESGPQRTDEIPFELLERFLPEARELGYNYIGVSGGEPLLWGELEKFLERAKYNDFSTSVSTNGTLLNDNSVKMLKELAGVVAVSVDGPPEEHAAMRRSETAFARMRDGLTMLHEAGVPFTLAFTFTKYNSNQLSWLYSFAHEVGAYGIHIHPLSAAGAAVTNLPDAIPDSLEFEVASLLMALLVEEWGEGGPAVFFDVIRRSIIEASNWPLLCNSDDAMRNASFTEIVPALIVEPDGNVVPFTYGFPRSWSLGVLGEKPLNIAVNQWQQQSTQPISEIVKATLKRLKTVDAQYVDLFGELMITAKQQEENLH